MSKLCKNVSKLSNMTRALSLRLWSRQCGIRAKVATKGMANDREINVANTQSNITQDASVKKRCNKKINATNKSQEVPPEVVSNEGLTPQEQG